MAFSLSKLIPNSSALVKTLALPANSETVVLVKLPTREESTCSYRELSLAIPDAWRPALWVNADDPTYGCLESIETFTSSAIWLAIGVNCFNESLGIVS